ncbi:MAG: arabinogalactan endo-1,4-beta-galactosidase [Treponema sp.]|nr:arabinogalactan endo-1,4-beta-galactosidase [Treponema sp.]
MKNNNKIKALNLFEGVTLSIMIAASISCSEIPSYSKALNGNAGSICATIDDTEVVVNPIDADLSSSFMRGFDSSADSEQSVSYKNAAGNDCDIYETLSDFGVNWVRLRVWNNPQSSKNPSVPGLSDKNLVVSQAVRAKAAGLKVLLDFHYSDYWADPGKQVIPEDWLTASDSSEMAENLYDYTVEVLTAMNEADAAPNMIQIGNEISSGILKHSAIDSDENVTNADSSIAGSFGSANYYKYLAYGIRAARSTCPNAKIMLHFTDINRNNPVDYLANFDTAFDSYDVDYDIVGLSWYSEWSSHGSLAALGEKIAAIKETYSKDVCVVETNVHWKYSSDSELLSDQHKANLVDSDGNIYSGILTDSNGNVIASIQNQANIVRAVFEVVAKNGGCGVFEWGGEYLGAWNSMFAGSGKPLSSLVVFGLQ